MRLCQIFAGQAIRLPTIRLFGALVLLAGAGAVPVSAQEIIVAGFRPAAPYVMQKADGGLTGLEYELVLAATQRGGLNLKPELAPFGRLPEDFRRGLFDAIVPASVAMGLPSCLSDTVLVYRNLVFTLAQRGLTLAAIGDLANLDVMAFQNAHVLLGPEMAVVRQGNPKYREVANQMLQVRALYSGRTDAVVVERRIFLHLARSSEAGVDASLPVAEHDLFAPINYSVAFRKPEQCLAFNRGLEALKRSGDYDAIMARWDGPLQARSNRAEKPPG